MKQKDITFLLISLFLVTVMWIGFTIYHNATTSKVSEAVNANLTPINGRFDTSAISKIKQREQVEGTFQASTSAFASPTPSPLPPIIPIVPIATAGGSVASGRAR